MMLKASDLDHYLAQTHQVATAEKRQAILSYFSEEPSDGHVWTEQDIWEQVRKMLR